MSCGVRRNAYAGIRARNEPLEILVAVCCETSCETSNHALQPLTNDATSPAITTRYAIDLKADGAFVVRS